MLRMGKEDKSPTQATDTDYSNRSYTPYQNNEAYRPTEGAATPKAKEFGRQARCERV